MMKMKMKLMMVVVTLFLSFSLKQKKPRTKDERDERIFVRKVDFFLFRRQTRDSFLSLNEKRGKGAVSSL